MTFGDLTYAWSILWPVVVPVVAAGVVIGGLAYVTRNRRSRHHDRDRLSIFHN